MATKLEEMKQRWESAESRCTELQELAYMQYDDIACMFVTIEKLQEDLKHDSKRLHDLQKFTDKEFSYHWSHLIHALKEYKRSKSWRQLDHHLNVVRKYDNLCLNDIQYAFMSGLIDDDQLEKVINAIEDVEFRVMELETEVIIDDFGE